MDCYPTFVKYLVFLLAFLHTLAGGHLVCCAHIHSTGAAVGSVFVLHRTHLPHHGGEHHGHRDHSHHQADEPSRDSICSCQDAPCGHEHACNGSGQLAISPQRGSDETAKLLPVPLAFFVSVVPMMQPSVSTGFRETVAEHPAALPLRLHLLYGLLLI